MRKRKALDSGSQPEQEQHMMIKDQHINNDDDIVKETTISTMETDMQIRTCTADIDVSNPMLQDVQDPDALKTSNSQCSLDCTSNLTTDSEGGLSATDSGYTSSLLKIAETKNDFLDFPRDSSELHGNDPLMNPSALTVVDSDLTHKGNADSFAEGNVLLSVVSKDNDITKKANDDTSNFDRSKGLGIAAVALEEKPAEELGSSCSIEQTLEAQTTSIEKVKHESEESNDASRTENENLLKESDMVLGASVASTEGNIRTISADCRESSSPIRGVIHYPVSVSKRNNRSRLQIVKREDVSFSFQTSDKTSVVMRKKLLVLDLNGLLADIVPDPLHQHRGRIKVGGKSVFKRPFCDDFLKFCFEKFYIGIWSSRRKYNVDGVIDYIMGDRKHKLLFCWDQSQCTDTGFNTLDNVNKPLVLKELKKLWNKEERGLPWRKGNYSASNTLLVDDSPYKALCNPPHTAIFPYPYHFDDETDTSLGPGGDLRVYLEGLSRADDVRVYVQKHPFGQRAITSNDPSWDFYQQVIEKFGQSSAPMR